MPPPNLFLSRSHFIPAIIYAKTETNIFSHHPKIPFKKTVQDTEAKITIIE